MRGTGTGTDRFWQRPFVNGILSWKRVEEKSVFTEKWSIFIYYAVCRYIGKRCYWEKKFNILKPFTVNHLINHKSQAQVSFDKEQILVRQLRKLYKKRSYKKRSLYTIQYVHMLTVLVQNRVHRLMLFCFNRISKNPFLFSQS